MTSTTARTNRLELYNELPDFGFVFTAATLNAAGATGLTSTHPRLVAEGAGYISGDFRSLHQLRPTLATADQDRAVGDISISGTTATLKWEGANYSDTTTDLDKFEISSAPMATIVYVQNKALLELKTLCLVPLHSGSPTSDADMQTSDATQWDDNDANVTLAKDTDAADNWITGLRSMSVTLTGAGGLFYNDSNVDMGASKSGIYWAIVRNDTNAGAVFTVEDSSGTDIESQAVGAQEWVALKLPFTLSSTQKRVRQHIAGTDSGDIFHVAGAWIVADSDRHFILPSWTAANQNRVVGLRQAVFTSAGTDEHTYQARSVEWRELFEGSDYSLEPYLGAANQSQINLLRDGLNEWPLYAVVETNWANPYGIAATITADTSTTNCPADLWRAQEFIELAKMFPAHWSDLLERGLEEKGTRGMSYTPSRPPRPVLPLRGFR